MQTHKGKKKKSVYVKQVKESRTTIVAECIDSFIKINKLIKKHVIIETSALYWKQLPSAFWIIGCVLPGCGGRGDWARRLGPCPGPQWVLLQLKLHPAVCDWLR